jgi:hypothetical protein
MQAVHPPIHLEEAKTNLKLREDIVHCQIARRSLSVTLLLRRAFHVLNIVMNIGELL